MVERKKREEVVSMEWERQWGVVGGVAVKHGGWWRELQACYVCISSYIVHCSSMKKSRSTWRLH